jgi:hypothetical protein
MGAMPRARPRNGSTAEGEAEEWEHRRDQHQRQGISPPRTPLPPHYSASKYTKTTKIPALGSELLLVVSRLFTCTRPGVGRIFNLATTTSYCEQVW